MQTPAPWWEQATGWKIKQTKGIFWFFFLILLHKKKIKKEKKDQKSVCSAAEPQPQSGSQWVEVSEISALTEGELSDWHYFTCNTNVLCSLVTKGIFFFSFTHPRHLTPRTPLPSSQQTQQDPFKWTCRVLLSVFLIEEFPTGCREGYFSPPQKVKRFVERAPAKLRKLHLWPGLQWRSQTRLLAS